MTDKQRAGLIFASGKKIRDNDGTRMQIESDLRDNSDSDFTHGVCPECAIRLYPEIFNKRH